MVEVFTFVGLHVGSQVAYRAVSPGAAVVFAVVAVDCGLFRGRVGAGDGQGGMGGLLGHFLRRSRVDLHVNFVQRNRLVDVTTITKCLDETPLEPFFF